MSTAHRQCGVHPGLDEPLVIDRARDLTEHPVEFPVCRHRLNEDQRERIQVGSIDTRLPKAGAEPGHDLGVRPRDEPVIELGPLTFGEQVGLTPNKADAVTMVHAFEPDPYLRALAIRAAENAPVSVSVGEAIAEDLPVPDGSGDAAVASLVLCSVKDVVRAVAELHRVVRPGGELRFNEHVASVQSLRRVLQRTADATVWPLLSGGCHLARDTGKAFEDGGFRIGRVERFEFSVSALDPKKTHILGAAYRA